MAAQMGPADPPPIEGVAWRGTELAQSGSWIRSLDDGHRAEIAAAMDALRRRGGRLPAFGREAFPLSRTALLLAEIGREIEEGPGVVRLRGLDVGRYGDDELKQVFWGIGCHLGTAMYQNPHGETIGEVRDETADAVPSFPRAAPGGVISSRARARSTGPLRFHTDLCDVIALLCVSNGREGGVSKLASTVTIYNEIRRRRPDLAVLLLQDYWRARPSDGDGPRERAPYKLPVFGVCEGKLTSQYSRTFVELAQQIPEVPRMSALQDEALDLLADIAEEVCLHAEFEPGDIQLINNHVVYHGRTAYADDRSANRARRLLRLWLSTPNSRRLPEGFEVLWGDIAPGVPRGGVVQVDDGRRSPIPAGRVVAPGPG